MAQATSKWKMNSSFLSHAAPIDHNDVLLPKIIHGKDLPKAVNQAKQGNIAFSPINPSYYVPQ
jgi:hypothetical protein